MCFHEGYNQQKAPATWTNLPVITIIKFILIIIIVIIPLPLGQQSLHKTIFLFCFAAYLIDLYKELHVIRKQYPSYKRAFEKEKEYEATILPPFLSTTAGPVDKEELIRRHKSRINWLPSIDWIKWQSSINHEWFIIGHQLQSPVIKHLTDKT